MPEKRNQSLGDPPFIVFGSPAGYLAYTAGTWRQFSVAQQRLRKRAGVGTAGRHPGGTRRLNLGVRRSGRENLPHPVQG